MHENLRDFDQVNLIDCEQLKKKLHEADIYNKGVLSQIEVIYIYFKHYSTNIQKHFKNLLD